MKLKNNLNRIKGTVIELAKTPYYIGKEVVQNFYQDSVRIQRSGLPAYIVGGAAAAITLPFRRVVVPATMAGRFANKNRKTPKGAVVAGVIGGMAGAAIVAYAAEAAILFYVFESMNVAATADHKAREKERTKNSPEEDIAIGKHVKVSLS